VRLWGAAIAVVGVLVAFVAGTVLGVLVRDSEGTTGSPSAAVTVSPLQPQLSHISLRLDAIASEISNLRVSLTGTGPEAPRPRIGEVYEIDIEGAPAEGPGDAKVTIVEFADFQCPYCASVRPALARIRREYDAEVRLVFKHLPIAALHPQAMEASVAAAAAGLQGKFWEMHDLLFDNQDSLRGTPPYLKFADEVGLDLAVFRRHMESDAVRSTVEDDMNDARSIGITGTPIFLVNGRYYPGAMPFERFKQIIDEELSR
jgi:protein-disulfide isomerase